MVVSARSGWRVSVSGQEETYFAPDRGRIPPPRPRLTHPPWALRAPPPEPQLRRRHPTRTPTHPRGRETRSPGEPCRRRGIGRAPPPEVQGDAAGIATRTPTGGAG
ncbi:hypothetical protein GCM10009535_43180 [Streptomyces thermocarboxydovorans]|uniref:Uncharacterized protein n=1 Tax=Streptomyces thermocarboxydovorans TaxID=59298 RepID=A0ABP3SXN9_9ACTN